MNKFTNFQLKKISSYLLTLSQISLGSVLLKFFEPGLEIKLNFNILIPISVGAVVTFGCLWVGMFFAAKVKS